MNFFPVGLSTSFSCQVEYFPAKTLKVENALAFLKRKPTFTADNRPIQHEREN